MEFVLKITPKIKTSPNSNNTEFGEIYIEDNGEIVLDVTVGKEELLAESNMNADVS